MLSHSFHANECERKLFQGRENAVLAGRKNACVWKWALGFRPVAVSDSDFPNPTLSISDSEFPNPSFRIRVSESDQNHAMVLQGFISFTLTTAQQFTQGFCAQQSFACALQKRLHHVSSKPKGVPLTVSIWCMRISPSSASTSTGTSEHGHWPGGARL